MAVEHLNGNGEVAKKFLGVRYESSISMGTLLVLASFIGTISLFWVNQEHRVTHMEDRQDSMQATIDGRIAARALIDQNVSSNIGKLQDQVNDMGLRVYKLEIDPKRK